MVSTNSGDGHAEEEEHRSVLSAPLPRVVEGVSIGDDNITPEIPRHIFDERTRQSRFATPPRYRRRPRDPRADDKSTAATREEQESHHQPSLSGRITRTALSGTLGVLQQVGGITLSATGALVAPPLHVTKTVLLPQLWAVLVDIVSSASPQRLKDWFKIVQTSAYHVVNTILNTDAGRTARQSLLVVWNDWVECVASEPSRQWVVDFATTFIKAADMLQSDEAQAFFDQLAVTISRGMDVVASARAKLVLHDGRQAMAALTELWADPATTAALAEVTAYICNALKMEQAKRRQPRKRRRHAYEKTVRQRDTVGKYPDMTVEEAILSSLHPEVQSPDEGTMEWDQASSSIRQQLDSTVQNDGDDDDDDNSDEEDFAVQAHMGVDVDYLREGIEERARSKTHEQSKNSMNPPDLEQLDLPSGERRREPIALETVGEDGGYPDNIPASLRSKNPGRLKGESNLEHFDRVVNEIMSLKHQDYPTVPVVGKEDETTGRPEQLKERREKARPANLRKQRSAGTNMLAVVGIVVALIGTMWFALGCFGLYQLVWKQSFQTGAIAKAPANNEIVIRVVKEVVHKSPDGKVLGRKDRYLEEDEDINTRIAECVSNLYN